ncbi:MAG: indolepyruvate oxidoreductase subunit beta [Deltaproteobacteria bacterium]|nr:indolepyruvate oxidoreductase subunit beta [Deltaproteobacteria bacterium]MBW2218600.1 indolepyruvate oxidoreductase subunit beta [Deltaproteobacteria bacterium]
MPLNMIIAGVGGQGNVLASQVVGMVAADNGFNVTIGETFGLSQRGGPVMSHVRLSKKKHYGPLIPPNMGHIIIGLEPLEALRIADDFANKETIFIVNSRPIFPLNVIAGDVDYPLPEKIKLELKQSVAALYWLDASDEAIKLGNPILMNMIMLGAACRLKEFPFEVEDIKQALEKMFPASKLEINARALEIGFNLVP